MNALPTYTFWLHTMGVLAAQTAVVLLLAAGLQVFLRSGRWRRTLWQTAFLGVTLLLVGQITGGQQWLASQLQALPRIKPNVTVRTNIPTKDQRASAESPSQHDEASAVIPVESVFPSPAAVWWPGSIWLLGLLVCAGWFLVSRGLLILAWRHSQPVMDEPLAEQVRNLAARLGLGRRVSVGELERLRGPIAFGFFHPTIGLPSGFAHQFNAEQRAAILTHELAHLAAGDPAWQALTDVVAAGLWWNPLVWWARRQWRHASETAADEASVIIKNGPAVLAECLVELGGQLARQGTSSWLGIEGAGFRSGLGQRVQHLFQLNAASWQPVNRWPQRLVVWLVPWVLAGLAVVSSARAVAPEARGELSLAQCIQAALLAEPAAPTGPTSAVKVEAPVPEGVTNPATASPARPVADRVPEGAGKSLEPLIMAKPDESLNMHLESLAAAARPPLSQVTNTDEPKVPLAMPEIHSKGASAPADAAALHIRLFKVDPNSLKEGLAGVASATKDLPIGEQLQEYFTVVGVDWGTTNVMNRELEKPGEKRPSPSKAMFFNDRTGLLYVRATLQDLDAIGSAIQVLNAPLPQVMIEAKLVEITNPEDGALAMDWDASLAQAFTSPSTNALTPSTALPAGFETNYARMLGMTSAITTNMHLQAASNFTLSAILTKARYKLITQALEQRTGVDVISSPRMITLSGQQAQMSVHSLRPVVTGINPKAIIREGERKPAGTNEPAMLIDQLATGPTLDIIPTVAADGQTVEMVVSVTMTEFLGYEPPGKVDKVKVMMDGKPQKVAPPFPKIRVRKMQTAARVLDGQTLVLSGPTVTETRVTKERFRKKTETVQKRLIVFLTATIVDPAGSPVHASEPSTPMVK